MVQISVHENALENCRDRIDVGVVAAVSAIPDARKTALAADVLHFAVA